MTWMNWRSILKVPTSLIPIHKLYFNILKQSVKWVNYLLIIERLFSVPRCAKIIRLPDTEMPSCGPGNHEANCRTEDSTAFYKPGLISWLTVNLFICECYTTQELLVVKLIPDTSHRRQCTFSANHWSLWRICVTLFQIIFWVLWEEDPNAGDPWHGHRGEMVPFKL